MSVRVIGYHRVRDIEAELSSLCQGEGPAPLFLVPSPGDRDLLRNILLDRVSFGPGEPAILRWEDMYRETLRELEVPPGERRRQIDPPDHWLIVRYILEEFKAGLNGRTVPPGALRRGFVWTLGENLRELLREEILPETLAASLGCRSCSTDTTCPMLSAPHGLLCRLYRDYLAYLDSCSLSDSAQTSSITSSLLASRPEAAARWIQGRPFVFTGFMSFTRSQAGLVREISRLGGEVAVFMPDSGLEIHDARAQLASLVPEIRERTRSETIPALLVSAGDHRLELETLCRNLALWEYGEGEFQLRLGMPFPGWGKTGMLVDSPRLETAEEILTRYRIPFVVSGGPTVSRTALWLTAASVIEAWRLGYPTEETAHILSQPWISPEGFSLSAALGAGPRGEDAWRRFLKDRGDRRCGEAFERMISFGAALYRGGTPSFLLRSLRSLIGEGDIPGWGRALSGFVLPDPGLDEAARRLNAAARELDQKLERIADLERDIGPAGSAILCGSDAAAFLSSWAERSTVWQPPKSLDSMTLYTGSPPVLAHHDIFAATGLTADTWPGKLRESPLLDDRRKEALHSTPGIELSPAHLPLLREKRMQREALLRRILASADMACIASRPCQDASGRPLQMSVMLDSALAGDPSWITETGGEPSFTRSMKDVLPRGDETILKGIESRADDPPRAPARLRDIPPPSPWPRGLAVKAPISGIDTWAQCPFRFYAERILGFRESRPFGFDPLAAGTMIHALWEMVWDDRLKSGDPLHGLAEKYWGAAVGKHYPELERLPRHLQRLRSRTLAMAGLQQMIEDGGLAKARRDQRRERDISLTVDGVPFSGRYDRLDMLDDGRALLFDYKTGTSGRLSGSLQLAAYAAALRESESIEVAGVIYLSQGDCRATGSFQELPFAMPGGTKGKPQMSLDEKVSRAGETMRQMASSISSGVFVPNYENSRECSYCGFQGLCRRSEASGAGGDDDEGQDE